MNKQEVLEYGLMVFNNEEEKFQHWLSTPVPALGDSYPLELLDDDEGLKQVENVLHRINYGIYS
jgi:putative toxin-antitoxin system antitoxin component (TIGR02293 family)